MMIKNLNRKHVHTIMNADISLNTEDAVIDKSLEFVAQMCDPDVLDSGAVFYIDTDDEGRIKLVMEI